MFTYSVDASTLNYSTSVGEISLLILPPVISVERVVVVVVIKAEYIHRHGLLCLCLYLFFLRCHWEVPLWLLFSFRVVSSRFREWSSLHSPQWFSPRRCKLLKLVHLILLKLTRISRPLHNRRITWTSACHCFDASDLCFVKAPGSDSEDSQDSSDSGVSAQKTREILARRPSYRWRTCRPSTRILCEMQCWQHAVDSDLVEKSSTTFHLRRWLGLRERTAARLPRAWQVLQSPRPRSTRPAAASIVRTFAFCCTHMREWTPDWAPLACLYSSSAPFTLE